MGRRTGGTKDVNALRNKIRIGIALAALAAIIVGLKIAGGGSGSGGTVTFTQLTEDAVPQDITSQIVPEYRDMERALACVVEDKVYVLATRGEKPTTGYDISIESMTLAEKDDKSTLTVNAVFTDPQAGASLTQEITYPYVVAETELKELPDKIQLFCCSVNVYIVLEYNDARQAAASPALLIYDKNYIIYKILTHKGGN